MTTVTSVSGGKTSAYLATKYPTDYNLFALVRTDDPNCKFPDEKLRREVEDRLQMPFMGTLEEDSIIYTILDLEQYIGKEISWVSGKTFDEVVETKGGWLPNKLHRYCTTEMKITPMFNWWRNNFKEPVIMQIGFRGNEGRRVERMRAKLNNGVLEFKAVVGKRGTRNKWGMIPWQIPSFPLFNDGILNDTIVKYWQDKPVRFAGRNNCVGCFHRNPLILKKMAELFPKKMNWFVETEKQQPGNWRSDGTYEDFINANTQLEISFDDFSSCDFGYCEL